MSLGPASCRGCTFSGHPHNEDCPEASGNKYQSVNGTRPTKYYSLDELLKQEKTFSKDPLIKHAAEFQKLLADYKELFEAAPGSSKNHQAWKGGYLAHVVETMNIALWLYWTSPRTLEFTPGEVLEVMFLHDLEKPWKHSEKLAFLAPVLTSKEDRKQFRSDLILEYGIQLTPAQENALRYVEGVSDSEYSPGERTMGELAAFCHCCDILSARLWHDKGQERAW